MVSDMKQGGMPAPKKPGEPVSVSQDIEPLIQGINDMLSKQEGGVSPGMAGESGALPASGGTGAEGAGGESTQIIAEVLGVSPEKAQALYTAAMAMPRLAGKSPAEIAEMLDKDMNLRMQLEKNMGAGEDMATRKQMTEGSASAAPAGPPPMEPTPSGGTK